MDTVTMIRQSVFFYYLIISLPVSAQPYVDMDSFFSSEPISLKAIDDDWQGEYHPNGEKLTASVWLESGFKKNGWALGALYREEHLYNFTSDTADLYYTISNDADLDPNRTYNIALDAYRFRGLGLRLANEYPITPKLNVSVGGSLFSASKVLEGSLTGSASAETSDTYDYQFEGDYVYDKDVLFGRPNTKAPNGIGLALDVGLDWKPTKQSQIKLNIRDLAGAIHWKDAPYTVAQANSDNVTTDEDGFSSVNPILSGFEGYRSSYTQHLEPSANLSAQYQPTGSRYTASAKLKYINDDVFYAIGGQKAFANSQLALHYWPNINTLEMGWSGKQLDLSLAIDDVDFSDARTFWLSLTYQ
ncbi:hypothetical protein EOL70_13045 [Leucothrix sargassi]|nr:hypothetical protein EOL70_13045 [Leucothrix sargassi]